MIPICVVAHPRREIYATKLAYKVGAEAVAWDVTHIGCSRNHMAAWQWLADSSEDWAVILEDDVVPCHAFHQNLTDALKYAPTPIVSHYLPRGRPPQYQQSIARVITQEVSYIRTPALLGTQGYAMRTELFLDYDRLPRFFGHPKLRRGIDESISLWAADNGYRIAATRRSLVDHLDGPSLVKDHGDGRGRGPGAKTELMMADCDPSGAQLPEIRRAWLMAGADTVWTLGTCELPL